MCIGLGKEAVGGAVEFVITEFSRCRIDSGTVEYFVITTQKNAK